MSTIIPDFTFLDSTGNHDATATLFVGTNAGQAFRYAYQYMASAYTNALAYDNIGTSSAVFALDTTAPGEDGGRILIPQGTGWLTTNNYFMCSFWFYPIASSTSQVTVIGTRPAAPTDTTTSIHGWSWAYDSSTGTATLNANGTIVTSGAAALTNEEWTFVSILIDATQNITSFSVAMPAGADFTGQIASIYKDVATDIPDISGDTNDITIFYDAYSGTGVHTEAGMSNLKFYDLTSASTADASIENSFTTVAQDAWAVYRPEQENLPSNLLATYALDAPYTLEGTAVIRDKNFQKRNLFATGFTGEQSVDYDSELPSGFNISDPTSAYSLVFDGSDTALWSRAYISTSPLSVEGEYETSFIEDYCIELWFKCTTLPAGGDAQFLVSKYQPDSVTPVGWYLQLLESGGNVNVVFNHEHNPSGTPITLTSTTNILVDTWYHVAVTASKIGSPLAFGVGTPASNSQTFLVVQGAGSPLTTYEDWGEIDPATSNGIGVNSTDDFTQYDLVVGASPVEDLPDLTENHFEGLMTEIRIWNRARTFSEIRATRFKQLDLG